MYGTNAWENYPFKPDYSVHAEVYRCIKCYRPVLDSDSAEEHQFCNKRHEYWCRVGYLQEHEKTYDGFLALMNRAIMQWGNPEYCYEWSHDMYGFCINCRDSNEIAVGDCSLYSCTGCRYGIWNTLFTFMIDITDWYEVIDDEISMCRSDIICNKPYLKEGSSLSFYGQDQATFWCDTLLFSKTKSHNIIGNTCIDCGYTEGDDQCNLCGNELCDFCGKCLDCDECDHCTDCNGELCEDCGECVECSTNPCKICCIHSWSDWTVLSHDENGHIQSRSCNECYAYEEEIEGHSRSLSFPSWTWNTWDWTPVTNIKILEDLLNTTITLDKDSCQYRHRQCVVCGYLEHEIENHKYNDDWDMRNYYEFWNASTGKINIIRVEPYHVYLTYGDGNSCHRIKTCINHARSLNCPRLFDDKESHLFKMYYECNRWEIFFGEKGWHDFRDLNANRSYSSLSEIGNFDEIVTWLNRSGTSIFCVAGWCSRCGTMRSRPAQTPQINEWHEWEGMCRRTITCINNSQYDSSILMYITTDTCYDILYEETKPHNIVDNACIDCGYTVGNNICTDIECIDPNCTLHGNNNHEKCYFCGSNEQCGQCGNCSICYNCRHCIDCGTRVWHHFEQYDPELGEHWSIVPELIGDGTWEDIIEWLSKEQNYINCFGARCNKCTTGQGTKITPVIKDWHDRIYSNGFSSCYRAISCSDCGDDVFVEAKVHNFVSNTCIGCGAMKE